MFFNPIIKKRKKGGVDLPFFGCPPQTGRGGGNQPAWMGAVQPTGGGGSAKGKQRRWEEGVSKLEGAVRPVTSAQRPGGATQLKGVAPRWIDKGHGGHPFPNGGH